MTDSPFDSTLLIGSEIDGRYRIEASLGAGGVGAVFRATHLKLGRQVAVKVLQEQYGASRELCQRFEREAKALAALSHPHVVTITDYGLFAGKPYLVMELLEGMTLGERLRAGSLEPEDALDIVRQLLRALTFVHDQGLVHRDLKPGNIFLQSVPGGRPHVKLLDFGLAKFIAPESGETTLTRAGQIFGTPAYMSPEQVAGQPTDASTDVYAVGILVFEMLAGRQPFTGNVSEVMRKHLTEPLPRVDQVRPGRVASPTLDALLRRSTAKLARERYRDAAELSAAIDQLPDKLLADPGPARTEESEARTDAAGTKRWSLRPGSGGWKQIALDSAPPVVAILVIGGLLVFLSDGRSPSSDGQPVSASSVAAANSSARAPAPAPKSSGRGGALEKKTAAAVSSSSAMPARPSGPPAITEQELWSNLPKMLLASRDAVNRGTPLSRPTMTYVHKYNADHRGDPRGHLILARSHMNRGWRKDAINEYAIAFKLNPAVRADPTVLGDLIRLVIRGSHTAADLIRKAYGPSAVDAVDEALRETTIDRVAAERLRELRDDLKG